jgi:DNA-directed RNA polymerase subunit beta
MSNIASRPQQHFAAYRKPLISLPSLVSDQLASYRWLLTEGIAEVFKEFSTVKDYSEKKFEFEFSSFKMEEPKHDEYFAKDNKLSYEATLKAMVRLKNKTLGIVKEQEMFLTDFPLMTDHGTFIIAGVERVIVPQLARSFGIFFTAEEVKGRQYFGAKIIPARGVWIEIEADPDGAIYVRIDKKRKFAVTSLLRVLGAKSDEHIRELFLGNPAALAFIDIALTKDHAKTTDESYLEIHKRLRDGEIGTVDNAKEFVKSLFEETRYDLSKVGRFRFNKRFGKPLAGKEVERKVINLDDVATLVAHIATLATTPGSLPDDIDHLG